MLSNRSKTIVTVFSVFWAIIGIVSLVPAGLSVMMFDAPGSERELGTVWLFRVLASFPFVCFLVAVTALLLNYRDDRRLALTVLLVPFINIIVGIAALVAIERFQGGKFGL